MVFSAEFFGDAALVAVGVAEDAVDDSVVDEQPAINATMHVASPAMRLEFMVVTTALVRGLAHRPGLRECAGPTWHYSPNPSLFQAKRRAKSPVFDIEVFCYR
jgi:hypothetical protein